MGHILYTVAFGSVIGFLAGKIMEADTGFIANVFFGIVGSLLGNWIAGLIGIAVTSLLANIIVSVVGACLIVFIVNKLK